MGTSNKLVGRERECLELDRVMESDRSEFVIVYGRRRVGKTFLVDQYYQGSYDFTFVGGHNLSRQRQLTSFGKALKKFSAVSQISFPIGLMPLMLLRNIWSCLMQTGRKWCLSMRCLG